MYAIRCDQCRSTYVAIVSSVEKDLDVPVDMNGSAVIFARKAVRLVKLLRLYVKKQVPLTSRHGSMCE